MDTYNNGKPIKIPESENEKALAISEWAEGNEHLQSAISSCINNGIQTYASCKGHGLTTSAYLSIRVTNENIGQVINIINNLSERKGINIALSFDESGQGSILTVYPSIFNKNNIFDLIASSATQDLDFSNANYVAQEMIRLHETLRIYGFKNDRMKSGIELHNGLMNRKFYLKHGMGSYDYLLDDELAKSHFKRKKDALGFRIFSLGGSNFGKELNNKLKRFNESLISSLTRENCEMVEDDEFISEVKKDLVRRKIKDRVIGKKGDRILKEVFDDKELARIVNDRTTALLNRLKISGLNISDIMRKYSMESPLVTKLSKNQALNIVKGFFDSIGIDVAELLQTGKSINESGQKVYLNMNPNVKRNETSSPTYESDDVQASVIETGTLRDVYTLVHEVTHTLYMQNGFNEARMILGEVPPQSMERMLDEYLMNLTKEEKTSLGFDDETLKEDIKTRKISTAINRFEISRMLDNGQYKNQGRKAVYASYMLAQIYSIQFMKFDKEERNRRILDFMKALRNNNIQQANVAFDINIDRRKVNTRSQYVNDCVWDLQQLLLTTAGESASIKEKSKVKQVEVDKTR